MHFIPTLGAHSNGRWMASRGERDVVAVGSLGKVKTAAQMAALLLLLLAYPSVTGTAAHFRRYGVLLLHFATALALSSSLQYFRAALRVSSA